MSLNRKKLAWSSNPETITQSSDFRSKPDSFTFISNTLNNAVVENEVKLTLSEFRHNASNPFKKSKLTMVVIVKSTTLGRLKQVMSSGALIWSHI